MFFKTPGSLRPDGTASISSMLEVNSNTGITRQVKLIFRGC